MKYLCNDGNGDVEIDADSAQEAAQEYVDRGDWGERTETCWVNVWVKDENGDGERIKIALEPDEPPCLDKAEHDWRNPYRIVGGIEENPGVWGHGGGVRIHKVCMRCGCERVTDTWAQDPETGEQGLESVSYDPEKYADELRDLGRKLD